MAFEGLTPSIITVCQDCVYYLEYGRLDDKTESENPGAGERHGARMRELWGDTPITNGCGSDCEDHGPVDDREDTPEPWHSTSACDGCGNPDAGKREHATAWEKPAAAKTLGEMNPEEREAAIKRAAAKFQEELTAVMPRIAEILE